VPGPDAGIAFVSALVLPVVVLVVLGSMLALAEAAISRMTSVRAIALREEGYRNAATLEKIEAEPARYLNAIYLSVMLAQNGSAILVAFLATQYFADVGVVVASVAFTLAYFVVVEAMSKTFAILHSDRVALTLAPFVWFLGRTLSLPTRGLIGLANVLLPGKGLRQGPFVTEHEIRSLADKGHEEGVIDEHEKELIHSVFQFGDRIARDIMVPRPDIVATEIASPVHVAADLIARHGISRIPVYRGELDHIEGIVHVKDVLHALHQGRPDLALGEILRPVSFVPESKRLAELLQEMQKGRSHLAIVADEYGSVSGMVTLEDLLEELVGQISDEHDVEAPDVAPLGDGRFRVNAALPIVELNEVLGTDLPRDRWNTVGGLVFGLAGTIPAEGAAFEQDEFRFTVEKVQGRRILTVIVARLRARPTADAESDREATG
jgi:CBS domain containing-hemolysin-like protein